MNPVDLIELCHAQAHAAEHNPEDAMLVSITQRDIWLLMLSLVYLSQGAPCLGENIQDLLERLSELIDVQKPHWREHKKD